jgi:S-DNA-T family DNA segregation ATPase FtsK/SpoIIIE
LFDGGAAHALERITRAGRDGAVRIVAAVENHALHRAFGGVAAELRKDKNGLLLDPDLDVDGDLLGVRLPRRKTQPFPPGRGYLVQRGSFRLIQVAI